MGYFQVRYDSRVVNYDRRGFIRLATEHKSPVFNPRWTEIHIKVKNSIRHNFNN